MRDLDFPALDVQGQRLGPAAGEVAPQRVDGGAGLPVIGAEPGRTALDAAQAVVGRPGQFMHYHPLLDQRDEGQEQLSVEPVLVEVVRMTVRGGDDHHPGLEQGFEQPAHDHGIGDVGDLHFVEGQHLRLPDHLARHGRQCVAGSALAGGVHGVVDLLHEGVEMHPPRRHAAVEAVHEQIHEHRLAAPDPAPQVQPPGRRRRLAEQAAPGRGKNARADAVEFGQHRMLCRVGTNDAVAQGGGIEAGHVVHGRLHIADRRG